jgi:hypothetical protein
MTDDEHDLLQLVYAETLGRLGGWVAVTELPVAALALQRNGYLAVVQDGSDLWRILTAAGCSQCSSPPSSPDATQVRALSMNDSATRNPDRDPGAARPQGRHHGLRVADRL